MQDGGLSASPSPERPHAKRLETYEEWKSVGPGVYEIRIHTEREYRVFYVARVGEAIYVLHAFEKRTRQSDIDLARRRLSEVIRPRGKVKES